MLFQAIGDHPLLPGVEVEAFANLQSILHAAFSDLPSRCYPLSYLPALLRLCCADGTSSTQLTIPVMSPHSQMVHGEDARKGGRTAYYRMLQGGTARIGEHHSTDESCKGHAASGGQAIPLEGIRLLALLRCHTRWYNGGRPSKGTVAPLHRHAEEGIPL